MKIDDNGKVIEGESNECATKWSYNMAYAIRVLSALFAILDFFTDIIYILTTDFEKADAVNLKVFACFIIIVGLIFTGIATYYAYKYKKENELEIGKLKLFIVYFIFLLRIDSFR